MSRGKLRMTPATRWCDDSFTPLRHARRYLTLPKPHTHTHTHIHVRHVHGSNPRRSGDNTSHRRVDSSDLEIHRVHHQHVAQLGGCIWFGGGWGEKFSAFRRWRAVDRLLLVKESQARDIHCVANAPTLIFEETGERRGRSTSKVVSGRWE